MVKVTPVCSEAAQGAAMAEGFSSCIWEMWMQLLVCPSVTPGPPAFSWGSSHPAAH